MLGMLLWGLIVQAGLSLFASACAVIRRKSTAGDFPISAASAALEIPAGKATVYLSGSVPGVIDTGAEKGSQQAYGDTRAQTISVLRRIQQQLQAIGLTKGDVVKMHAVCWAITHWEARWISQGSWKAIVSSSLHKSRTVARTLGIPDCRAW